MSPSLEDNGLSGYEIAVIGMAGRFPGARSIHEFRENLENGQESISFFSDKELAEPGGTPGLQESPNYVKAKGILEGVDCFDAAFFNYTLPEAEMMDPQFRILHEFSWKALEDAGYDPGAHEGYIGFYVGATTNLYWIARMLNRIKDPADKIGLASLNDHYSLSTQVAYRLNLKGPAVTVQTACSTSLVAIHHACQALLSGECDMAMAGGVSVQLPVKSGYLFQEGMVFSSDGHCRAFDANADGTVGGDGVGIVVLKLLENAREERDHIYAVIKGSAINNDGNRKVGYTAPSIDGQAEVIRRAHQAADVEPESITYVETHGTGTSLGDPVEIQALIRAFNGGKRKFCRLGSVKSNIGHLDSAAGAAGFIKTVLALYHKRIPPTLHFETPNPKIDFENSPFIVNRGLVDWQQGKSRLRAGVSSFGIGGTNAHVILEEPPRGTGGLAPLPGEHSPGNYRLILLSAKTQAALERNTANLVDFFKKNPGINLADVAYTLQVGRKAFEYRRTLVCKDVPEAVEILSTRDSDRVHSHLLKEENPAVVFMFPGLGSQYVNMGAGLYRKEPVFREEMDRCFEILKGFPGYDLKEILYPSPAAHGYKMSSRPDIHRIEISQPLVFSFEYALVQLLAAWGIRPNALIGYSFGEYAAACAAGIFSVEDALTLIVHRGELIRKTPAGAMLSVPLPGEELVPLFTPGEQVWLAIDNGSSCIVSGAKTAVEDFEKRLKRKRLLCMRLDASYALHSPLMDPILSKFAEKVRKITLKEPQVPLISNVTGQWLAPGQAVDPTYWVRHLQGTVCFADGINELVKEPRAIFVELGPGRDLGVLVQRFLQESHRVIDLVRSPPREVPDTSFLLDRLGRLWAYGRAIDWNGFYPGEERYRLPLPTYSFEARRFPLDQSVPVSLPRVEQPTRLPETYRAPANHTEEKIANAFHSIFGLDNIGPHEDFFELGGDSLKVIVLVTRLHRELGVEIPMDAVFKNPTIKKIAAYIGQIPGQPGFTVIPPVEEKEYYPLAPPQRRIFIMDQLEEKNKAYNMPSVLWMEGTVDIPPLEDACQRLFQRHESLRTGFFLENGEPVQRVYSPAEIEFSLEYVDLAAEPGKAEQVTGTITNFIRPFDLNRPPLWRMGLAKLEQGKYLLMQNLHHIISDDISIGIMLTELTMLLQGERGRLDTLRVQYKDYAVWQRHAAAESMLEEQKRFWTNRFAGAAGLPVLEMPCDYPRPPVQTFTGSHLELKLETTSRDKLLELARDKKTTLFVLLFTAYNILLHHWTCQEDIIVGTPITGRSHRDVQQVVGMFVNTLAMRTHPHSRQTCAEFLQQVKEETLAAFTHQLYPFEDLVEQLDLPRDISRNPLFDTMFVLHTVDLEMVGIPGVKLSPYEFDRRVSKFDITLNAADTKSGLHFELEYNTSLFKAETMRHFMDDYIFILERLSANPGIKLAEIKTSPFKRKEEERKRILEEFNRTEADFPADKPLHRFFTGQVQRTPGHTALVGANSNALESCDEMHLSYGELNENSNRLTQRLIEKGAGPGTIVGIMMERSFAMVTGILSILKAGSAYLPIDPEYPEERIRFMLDDSKVNILVKKSNNSSEIEIFDCQWSMVNGQREKHKTSVFSVSPATSLAYVLYTSGSSGKPKGVMVEHRSVVNLLYALKTRYPLYETDTFLLKTSFLFDVSVTELLGWFWQGGRLAILAKDGELDPGQLLDTIRRYQVTHINFVPSLFTVFVDYLTPRNITGLGRLRYVFLAGEALLPQPVERFKRLAPGIALENIYGPTEATVYASRYSLRDRQEPTTPEGLAHISGPDKHTIPIGKPLPNVRLYVLDKYDQLQPLGAAGELCISGTGLARGYLNKPEMTFDRFCLRRPGGAPFEKTAPPGPPRKNFLLGPLYRSSRSYRSYIIYRSGDLARWLTDGNLEFLGRLDSQVKVRGNRVELGEVESHLLQHEEIKEAVVLAKEDESREKALWAYYVSDREFDKGELRRFLAEELPDFMIPSYFIPIPQMPYTKSGKIDRKMLFKAEDLQSKPGTGYVAPGTDLEKTIAETWKSELKSDQIGIDDNFMDLGGTSLKIIRVMSRLKKVLQKEIPIVTLFRHPTIRSLAHFLTQSKSFAGGPGGQFFKRAPLVAEGKEIAVIGMSCRFPGARNLDRYWTNLKNGIEAISFFSTEELAEAGVDREQLDHPGYVRAMGFIEGIREFDAHFFDYAPLEAEVMDPQIRLFQEVAWEALEDAGYVPETYEGLIGLYAGAAESFYWKTLAVSSGKIDTLGAFELDKLANKDYLCARTAYKLNLKGPVVFVQTACSTSLAAIHLACRGLLSGETDIGLAGGVSIMQYKSGYIYQEGMIRSPDGHCRAFADNAQGTLAGSGLGVVVLKPWAKALRDNDHIYAVIKGSAMNNDGRQKIGFTAPSVEQQAEVIASALATAGVGAESIGYVEAHGTGTPMGDPVEIEALNLAFNTAKRAFCGIGSVKTNLGHLDSAAGVAGFIKTVLALTYKQIPPSLHFEIPNLKIDFIGSPFYISTVLREWENHSGLYPRRAGVSSLGLGGTNVHVILEEVPQPVIGPWSPAIGEEGKERERQLILLSAKTRPALDKMTGNLVAYLTRHPGVSLADVAYTLQVGRKAFKYRRAVVCSTPVEAIAALSAPGPFTGVVPGKKAKDTGLLGDTVEAWLSGKEIDWRVFYSENNQTPYRISLPLYPFVGKFYWLEGNSVEMGSNLSLKKSSIDKKPDLADWFYLPSWKRVQALPFPGDEPPDNNCCMVFADEGGIGVEIAGRLERMNREVVVVMMGSEFTRVNSRAYMVNPRHKGDYDVLFNTLKKSGLFPGKIIHLWSLYEGEPAQISEENLTTSQYRDFHSLTFLAAALDKSNQKFLRGVQGGSFFKKRPPGRRRQEREIEITVVTANTQNITGDDLLYPGAAAVSGPVKVIPQEYPYIICRHIDVDSRSHREQREELVDRLAAEFFPGTREPVVAYRGRSRWVQTFDPLPLGPSLNPVPRLRQRGVYLITGGFGNIGFTLAQYLARAVQARLILVGRSPVPVQSQPDRCPGSSKVLKIKQLEQLGGEVLALSADVSHPGQMETVVVQAEGNFGPINGVFHTAGDTRDSIACTIEHLEEEQIQSQFRARVYGLVVLEQIFKNRQTGLDFCLAVSSLVSVLGGLGFAAYAAAMSVMDAYIHFHNRKGARPWMSVNTAEWLFREKENLRGTVFSGAETVKLAMTEEEGLETFARILSHCHESQVIVSTGDLRARIDKWVKLEALRGNERAGKSDPPSLHSLHPRPELSVPYVPADNPVEQAMVELWQAFFAIGPIGIEDDFFQLGGDSLKAITMLSKIHKELDIKLTVEEFFKQPVIKQLSRRILLEEKEEATAAVRYRSIEPVEKKEYYPLASAQQRLYLVREMAPGSTAYNIPLVLPLAGDIDKRKPETIFKRLLARHESLRTSFTRVGEEPVQRVHSEVDFEIEYYQVEGKVKEEKVPFGQVNAFGGQYPKSQELRAKSCIHSFIRPFDLSRAPLLRSALIGHAGGNYTWIADMHHIIADGISQAVLTGEFVALYHDEELEPLPLQYKDFSGWQQRLLAGGGIKTQEDYWLNLYAAGGEIPRLDLPTDTGRPAVFTFAGAHYGFRLEGEVMARFRELGSRNGATLFMGFLALLNVLFYKYTGQTDLIIGTGTAGRRQSDFQEIIGMFVNTLAMRNYPQGDKTYETFLKEVGGNSLHALENQDLRFEELVDHLDLERDPSRNPLFDICLVVQNFLEPIKNQPSPFLIDENFIVDGYKNPSSRFDMTFFIHEAVGGIFIDIEYYTGIFAEGTIRRLVSHLNRLFNIIIYDPLIKLKDIEIVSEEEKQQLLDEFNDTGSVYPKEKTIHELFTRQVTKTPHHTAVVFEEEIITYSELNRRSDRLAATLFSTGAAQGDAVGVMMDRCLEMIAAILAILKAGGCYLPINLEYPETRKKYLLEDSSAGILLVKGQNCKYTGILTIDLQEPFILKPGKQQTRQGQSNNLAYIMYTSGSTGNPKGVMVTHRNVVRLVKNTDFLRFDPEDRILATGALEFDASTFEIWGALLNGLVLGLVGREKILAADQLKQSLRKYDIRIMWMTAPLFNRMLQADIEIFAGLRYLLVGGEVLSPVYINRLREKFPRLRVINGYGPTENTTFSTTYRIDKEYGETIPIGKPIANSTAYIINKNGQLQPVGIVGELCVGGDGVARGYLNNPELTFEKFCLRRPGETLFARGDRYRFQVQVELPKTSSAIEPSLLGWVRRTPAPPGPPRKNFLLGGGYRSYRSYRSYIIYRSGDLARWLPDGNIQFCGRIDQQVKIRGFRVEPNEIEHHLNSHHQIHESLVLVREETGEKYLCAYVVTDKNLEIGELRGFLADKLPGFMVPAFFLTVDKIPLTPNGKVDRNALPEPAPVTGSSYVSPGSETEKKLVEIWSEILGRDALHVSQLRSSLGIDDNFFELGGHSLKATLLVSRIQKELGAKVSLAEVFNTQTIRALSAVIKKSSRETFREIEAVEKREYYELSFNQKRLWIIQQKDPADNSYHMTGRIVLNRQADEALIRRSVRTIIERHESLRTGFKAVEGQGIQFVLEPGGLPRLPLETEDMASLAENQKTARLKQVMAEFYKRPFHLGEPPLFRSLLIKVKEDFYIFAFCMHHIVSDGWSMEILEREFFYIHNAYSNNRDIEPFAAHVTYKDFTRWHNRQLETASVKSVSREFWITFLKGELPRLRLPVDTDRGAGHKTKSGAGFRFVIPAHIKDALKTIGSQHHITLFTLIYSLYNTWLARTSGQAAVVSGIVNAGREHPSLQDIVGFFVNPVLFRIQVEEDDLFIDFAKKVGESVLEFFQHQHYPLELVLAEVGGKYPEVTTAFNMLNINGKEGIPLENHDSIHHDDIQNVKFDLEPYIAEFSNGIEIIVNYRKNLFKPKHIEYMMETFRNLVEFFALNPHKRIKEYKETQKRRSFKKG